MSINNTKSVVTSRTLPYSMIYDNPKKFGVFGKGRVFHTYF